MLCKSADREKDKPQARAAKVILNLKVTNDGTQSTVYLTGLTLFRPFLFLVFYDRGGGDSAPPP